MSNATKWQPNEDQLRILKGLQAEAAQEKTVVEFARKFLPFGRSMFDQIMDALDPKRSVCYFDNVSAERTGQLFSELTRILEEIPLKRAVQARIREIKIIETSKIVALRQAIREAGEKTGPERLIVNVGPTGGGKTMTCNWLMENFSARFVEVRDIWRDSKTGFVPLVDICRAVGLRGNTGNNMAAMQDDLIRYAEDRKMILCFDEGEHFGRASLNLLKLLLNRTRIVPVLFCVPGEYDKWAQWFPNESSQIARRTHAIIDNTIIAPADARLFFPKNQFADPDQALDLLSREASRFGHYSLIKRVADKLDGVAQATSAGDGSDLVKAIKAAKRQMLRDVK